MRWGWANNCRFDLIPFLKAFLVKQRVVLKGWQIRYSYIHCLCSVSTRNTQCFIEGDSVRLQLPEVDERNTQDTFTKSLFHLVIHDHCQKLLYLTCRWKRKCTYSNLKSSYWHSFFLNIWSIGVRYISYYPLNVRKSQIYRLEAHKKGPKQKVQKYGKNSMNK